MTDIDLGAGPRLDLSELLATRLLVQGSSGSGKTYLLRRLLEQTAPHVQQLVIDPEGEFRYLCALAGHTLVDAARYYEHLPALAAQARERRISCVIDLSALPDPAAQVGAVAAYVAAAFEAPRDHWHPCLVVVDEVHLFAGDGAAGDKPTRLASLSALANLMCRGRKRGLAGIVATQRVSKLAKNVAAEAGNLLVGRTLLDIDLRRAAGLVGLPPQSAPVLRDLRRGEFMALGPALASHPTRLVVGPVAPPVAASELAPAAPRATTVAPVAPPCEPAPLPGVLGRLHTVLVSAAGERRPWPGYAALAAATPGVLNSLHARRLCDSLAGCGRLELIETLRGVDFIVN